MKYEALIHCEHSRRDSCGNVYWLARFTNPSTGEHVEASLYGGEGNAKMLASRAIHGDRMIGLSTYAAQPAIAYCTESEIPVREWSRRDKALVKAKLHEASPNLLEELHRLFHPRSAANITRAEFWAGVALTNELVDELIAEERAERACMSCRDGLDCPRDPACHA